MSRPIGADKLWMEIIRRMDYCEDMLEIIKKQPTVEVERKRGKWITESLEDGFSFVYSLKCSECGKYYAWEYNFCPNCGADMRGEK